MIKYILLIIVLLSGAYVNLFSQFTKWQVDELTARGVYYALEPDNPQIKSKAEEITQNFRDSSFIQSLCAVFDYVNRNWDYASDPDGMEYFEKAGVSVNTFTGDCDDYAILMVSLVKALGGEGRVVCVSGHAYPEIYLARDMNGDELKAVKDEINSYYINKGSRRRVRNLNYHNDPSGYWLNFDYQDRFPGGKFVEYSPSAEHLVIYSDGEYELSYLNR